MARTDPVTLIEATEKQPHGRVLVCAEQEGVSKGVRELWLSVARGQDCAQYRAHAVAAWHALTAVPVQPLGVVRLYHAARGAAVARRAAEQLTGNAQDLAS